MMRTPSFFPCRTFRQRGFTLVEMIMVIVITGIIGAMVAVFIQTPVRQYTDVSRRAEMSDIADTALRRITRDLRLALPNSVRVRGACDGTGQCLIEFLPTLGGGRYRAASPGDMLDFAAADASFEVLGPMPTVAAGNQIVVYNLGIPGADAYAGSNRATAAASAGGVVNLNPAFLFPFESPAHRFQVVSTPVSYMCDGAGTLWRYWGYAIQPSQPASAAELTGFGASSAKLATSVSRCLFAYNPLVVGRSGLVTMQLAISQEGETVTLYGAAHVSNQP